MPYKDTRFGQFETRILMKWISYQIDCLCRIRLPLTTLKTKARVDLTSRHDVPYSVDLAKVVMS